MVADNASLGILTSFDETVFVSRQQGNNTGLLVSASTLHEGPHAWCWPAQPANCPCPAHLQVSDTVLCNGTQQPLLLCLLAMLMVRLAHTDTFLHAVLPLCLVPLVP